MNTIQKTIAAFFLLTTSILAQTSITEDIIKLTTGEKYEGMIIEQKPGTSIKFVDNASKDTLTFFLMQIASMQKQTKLIPAAVETPTNNTVQEKKQPTLSYEQDATYQIGNDLTIFSEDEYKFRVYINGKPYNQNFATRVAIENINHNWAKVSVLFEDPAMGVIEEDIALSPYDGDVLPYTCTYKVKTNKKGKLNLSYYSASTKKVAPGSANVLIHRSSTPNNVNFQIQHNTHISR